MEIICLNGEFMRQEDARIRCSDSAFLWGHSTFSTIRVEGGQLLHRDAHFQRLFLGARQLGIPCQIDFPELTSQCEQVLDCNQLTEARLRITLSRGPVRQFMDDAENEPTLLITAVPLHDVAAADWERGWRLVTVPYPINEHSPLRRFKSGNYSEYLLAREYAKQQNADEGLLMNTQEFVAECAMSNIFWFRDGVLFTPPLSSGALPGVVRQVLLKLAVKLGLQTQEKLIYPEELISADEIFCTNSTLLIMPITRIEDQFVSGGLAGAQTRELYKRYRDLIEMELGRYKA
ncbi:MAG: aminotransferase class IV [Sumerlaeia bacterium]